MDGPPRSDPASWNRSILAVAAILLHLAGLTAAAADDDDDADDHRVAPPVEVSLELVLAVDVSSSIDAWEAEQQRRGYIAALTDPAVINSIRAGTPGRIAVTYVEWSGSDDQRIIVPWRLIDGPAGAAAVADALAAAPVRVRTWTSISAVIDLGVQLIESNGYDGRRRVIDISGDGISNRGRPVAAARDAAIARGITINGLPILNDRPNLHGGPTGRALDLDRYYREQVIGGPRAFLVVAHDFEQVADAVRRKLLLEIAGGSVTDPTLAATGAPLPACRRCR